VQFEEGLFRRDSGRMVAALTRIFGLENLALAEDVVQDAFCRAVEVWKLRGLPENPSAWLMRTAKNRAIDLLRRERTARNLLPKLANVFESEWTLVPTVHQFFDPQTIEDDQLRMMFSCCDPALSQEAQIALILNLLCGFTANEIANAFLSSRSAIEKRIARGKNTLAASKRLFDLSDSDFTGRLAAVHRALYLLFNEGYHGASPHGAVRSELCREAMRLASLLLEQPLTATPPSYALCALMWLHAARLPARVDDAGNLTSLLLQDRSRWDAVLASKGENFLERAARGDELSEYHIEAAIAAVHAKAAYAEETDWAAIVSMYDALMKLRPSPVIGLNRAIAIAQKDGAKRGLEEIRAISGKERLESYPFYFAALGEFELRAGSHDAAGRYFERALALARNSSERRFLEARIAAARDARAAAQIR